MPLPSAEQQARLDELNAAIATREAALAEASSRRCRREWEADASGRSRRRSTRRA